MLEHFRASDVKNRKQRGAKSGCVCVVEKDCTFTPSTVERTKRLQIKEYSGDFVGIAPIQEVKTPLQDEFSASAQKSSSLLCIHGGFNGSF